MFLAPNFECFTNDAFCSHSFDYVWRHMRLNGGCNPQNPPWLRHWFHFTLASANAYFYYVHIIL